MFQSRELHAILKMIKFMKWIVLSVSSYFIEWYFIDPKREISISVELKEVPNSLGSPSLSVVNDRRFLSSHFWVLLWNLVLGCNPIRESTPFGKSEFAKNLFPWRKEIPHWWIRSVLTKINTNFENMVGWLSNKELKKKIGSLSRQISTK
jgi:hypothetical protein